VPGTDESPPSGLRVRLRALVHELGKFGTVGAVAFAIDLAIFNVLRAAGMEALSAKTLSTVVATTFAFAGNRYWTWRDREHSAMARQYGTFFGLNAVGLAIGLACLAASHYGLGRIWPVFQSQLADNVAGQLVGTALGTMFRFWSYRRFVFPVTTAPHGERRGTTVSSPPSPVRDSA
jgi:putative flippase GtrA